MSVLTASNLAKSYGPQDVFAGISLEIPHAARIALIGPNGCGKTTLLHLLAGLEAPSAGVVHRAKGLRIGYLPQQADLPGAGTLWDEMLPAFADLQAQAAELRRLEDAMADPTTCDEALQRYGPALEAFERAGGYIYEQRIAQVLTGLGFDQEDFDRPVAHLSGGQQTRAMLARLLLEEPDLLLLDEPTNHLDLAGIEWLEEYLKTWPGAVVVVAHDRAFLDAVVERVWELEFGRLEFYRGNYSAYAVQKAERLALRQAEYARQQQFIARTEDFIRRNIAGQRSREAKGRLKRLERLRRGAVSAPRNSAATAPHTGAATAPHTGAATAPLLDLGKAARSGDLVVGLYDLAVGYNPASPLFTAREFELRRGQRLALLGRNGSGKTTLVRTILGELAPLAGRVRIGASVEIGYFAQGHTDLDLDKSVLETILDTREMTAGEARNLLGRYRFSGDDAFKRVGDLSGGEQARVALAVLALQGANVLVLDEPTNHLDISSQEVLQAALADFGGTLLIVTHDRYLIRRLCTCVWAIEDGRLWEFKEGYDEYHAWEVQRRQSGRVLREPSPERIEREVKRQAMRAAEREATRQARRRAELEQAIHRAEARLAQLEAQLAAASEQREVERVRQLGHEHVEVKAELDRLLAAWTEVVG